MSTTNTEPNWQPARLIPIAGIRGPEEQEARATSAFLAVLRAVPEFGAALLSELGAPRGRFETFTEVRFKDALGTCRPDGAIVASRGAKTWRALVEVKTGRGALSTEQTNRYLDIARDNGFDCVLTISNEITSGPTEIPVVFDRRKARQVAIFHLSWWRIITTAVLQHRHRGLSDPDQAWILGELIAYLDHENSGASGFQDMGSAWVSTRDAARAGTLRPCDRETRDVVRMHRARRSQPSAELTIGTVRQRFGDWRAARPRLVAPGVAPDAEAAPEGAAIPHDCWSGPVAQLVRAADS